MPKKYRRKKPAENLGGLFLLIPLVLGGILVPFLNLQPIILTIAIALIIFVILGVFIVLLIRYQENQKLKAVVISEVDRMSGVEFEKYVGEILKFQGYDVKFTAVSGDYGIDILATRGPERLGIQLKRYSGSVGNHAVQEAHTGLTHYNCNKGWVITNSYFTEHAKITARDTGVELFDRDKLAEWILNFSGKREIKDKIADSGFAYEITKKHSDLEEKHQK